MNFYKLYIGDYQRDTAHLSVTEHGAYMLMLQHYYATERPLPTGKALHRMLRAQDKHERDAIDTVVEQFWRETPDGLINARADAEIAKASTQAGTNRRIAVERETRRKAARDGHEESTNRVTNGEPNQTPDTRHQKNPEATHPTHNTIGAGAEAAGAASSDPEDSPPTPEPEDAAPSSRRGELAGLLRGLGVVCTYAHPVVVGWANGQGVSDDEVREAVAVARMQKGDAPIPVKYLVPIVEEMRRPKAPATPRSPVTPQWWASEGATLAEASRLGLTPHRGEEMPAFRDRIRAAQQSAKNTAGEAA